MKRFMAFLISCSLLLSMTPSAFATDDIEGGNLDEIGTINSQDIAGDSTDGQSLTKEQAKLIPGGEYTFTDDSGTHTWKINSTFDFVEDDIAYKQVSDTEVEVAAWYWVWDCGSGHTHSPGTLADREYKNRADGITVPTSITHEDKNYTVIGIGTRAFEGVTGTPVTVPEGITYLGHSAFWGFGGDSVNRLTIPTTVTSIDDSCFADIKVSTVTFTDGSNLKSIGDTAFRNCQNLTEVVLPEGLETMGSSVFALSNSLNITIPGTVENFNKETLSGYSGNLDNITFTDGPANLIKENGIIYGYNKILEVRDKTVTEVVIPDGITEIGEKAFSGCNNLQSVTIPDSVTSIGNEAFHGRSTLTTINGGSGVTTLGDWAFLNCTALTTVNFPNVKTIGERTFDSCTALVSVKLPNIETIGDKAFYKCTALSDLSFLQNSVQEIGYEAFYGCQAIESIVLPESLRTIGAEAFANCLNVKEISLSEGVETIGERAFDLTKSQMVGTTFPPRYEYVNSNPKLEIINIPSTVTSLGANFLRGIKANGETTLISQVTDPSIFEGAVGGISGENKPTLYYPNEVKAEYETAGLITEGDTNGYALSLTDSSMALASGENSSTLTLTATVPTGMTLSATSSNPEYATVDTSDGLKVTGVSEGTATITAQLKVGDNVVLEDTCTVTVTAAGAVIPTVEEPKTSVDSSSITESGDQSTATTVAGSVTANETITSAAQSAASSLNSSAEKDALINEGKEKLSTSAGEEVSLYTQTYLKIEATGLSKDAENSAITSITLDITPMMQVVASTATNSADIKLDSNGETNAVVVQDPKELEITTSAEITVKLPEDFKSQPVFVKHEASNDRTYFYQADAKDDGTLTFTSYHGFSPFTFSLTNGAVAFVDGIGYASFQEAVNAAAADGDVVEVFNDDGDLTATVSGSSRTITVKNSTDSEITVTLNDKTMKLADNATWDYTYTRPGGGGGVSTYAISTPSKVDNGTIKVSPTRASSGTTVTITVTPDEGYELAKLTVTDKDGDTVKLTDKGDGKYTFTMPASAVEVEASFQEIVVEPDNPFIDVYESDYYYDAVLWAVENGVTVGTSATTFSPNVTVSRAQMVTFLWRAYGSPEATGENPFTDVSESEYYYDAVLWAVENGITVGTTSTTFSPEAPVTRAQAVTFQWRAAGSPAASGDSFNDVSDDVWYSDAVTWAVANGVTNGTGGNSFSPEVAVSRAQAVTFLYRELG